MADDPTTEPPEGYWEDMQKWVMDQFKAGKTPPTAPPPDPKTDPKTDPPTDPPKKRKSWFSDGS